MSQSSAETFRLWAEDNQIYGPVDTPTLIQWIQDERVFPETFVQSQSDQRWRRAGGVQTLREQFSAAADTGVTAGGSGLSPSASDLRDLPVFAGLSNEELDQIAALGQFHEVKQNELIVRQGDPCDAVYFILAGELRARLIVGVVDRMDKTLSRMGAGEFFGELGMFLRNKRTADVIAETPCHLFRLTTNAFDLLIKQIPALGSVVLFNIASTMARRIADDNHRYYREVTSSFLWS
jgi:hypothetical protein